MPVATVSMIARDDADLPSRRGYAPTKPCCSTFIDNSRLFSILMRQEPSKTLSLLFEAPLCHRRAKQDDFRERGGGSHIGGVASLWRTYSSKYWPLSKTSKEKTDKDSEKPALHRTFVDNPNLVSVPLLKKAAEALRILAKAPLSERIAE